MLTLALDVDGVLLDPDRAGRGRWTNELTAVFGIDATRFVDAFFARSWAELIIGRRSVEEDLAGALRSLGHAVEVEALLSCWFDADYVPFQAAFDLAVKAADAGCRVVLATDQEHRRAEYLRDRIGSVVRLDNILYSAQIGYRKRDGRFFVVASELLGLRSNERSNVVFVDDHADNVAAARLAGWQAVHAAPGVSWHREVEALLALPSCDHGSDR